MEKKQKFLKFFKRTYYVVGGFFIASSILAVPTMADPFVVGFFTTMGGAIPLLIAIYLFHYLPIKRAGLSSVPILKQRENFISDQIVLHKNLMRDLFGTEDYVVANDKLKKENSTDEHLQKILFDQSSHIGNLELQELEVQLEITYKKIYSFDKYVYDIFHRKFFGLSDYEKYWNYGKDNSKLN